jgi:hypothetical protein
VVDGVARAMGVRNFCGVTVPIPTSHSMKSLDSQPTSVKR